MPRAGGGVRKGGPPGSRIGRGSGENRGDDFRSGAPRSAASRKAAPARRGGPNRPPDPADQAPRTWGSLARRSLRNLSGDGGGDGPVGEARKAWRDAVARARGDATHAADTAGAAGGDTGDRDVRGEPWEPETWIDEGEAPEQERQPAPRAKRSTGAPAPAPVRARRTATGAAGAGAGAPAAATGATTAAGGRPRRKLPKDVSTELATQTRGAPPNRAERYQERLADAAKAYERDRYRDAQRMLKPLAEALPGASAVRELYGLTLYRLGRWNDAIRELEAFRALEPDDYDQHPTLADCYRAKKRWKHVDELWEELRQASPSAELVAEGRIVAAGALADRGQLAEAIALLEKARTDNKRPRPHHLRIWYATADLYERAGETPRARDLFRRVFAADPELYDVADRLRSIR